MSTVTETAQTQRRQQGLLHASKGCARGMQPAPLSSGLPHSPSASLALFFQD